MVASFTSAAQAPGTRPAAGGRFEVTSIKAVRPTLVNTIDALKKGDTAKDRDAFEAYDTAWNRGVPTDKRSEKVGLNKPLFSRY